MRWFACLNEKRRPLGETVPVNSRLNSVRFGKPSLLARFWIYLPRMLSDYLRSAMRKAHYEVLDEKEGCYGEIPGFQGVFAQASTLESCREELASTLEDWLLFRLSRQLPTSVV